MSTLQMASLAAVNGPPATPPTVGLVQTAKLLGPAYLIDDEVEYVDGVVNGRDGNPVGTPEQIPQRWAGGFQYLPETVCGEVGQVRDPCSDSTLYVPAQPSNVIGIPVLVETGDRCSAFGWSAHNYIERATRRLAAVESKLIAAEFWTGAAAQGSGWDNQWLADGANVDVVYGTVQAPGPALALLEQAIAADGPGAPGAIYCTRQLGAAMSELGQTFRSSSSLIQTYMGSVIVPDAGFPGTGPTGQAVADGSQWAFATLLPQVRRSPVEVYPETFAEALDRSTNTVEFRAMRYMSVSFDPCVLAAVQVNLPLRA